MSKKLCFIVLMLLASVELLAARDIGLGGKIGIGVGWWRGSDYSENVDVTGAANATIGAYTFLEVHKYVALQFEFSLALIGNSDERKYSNFKVERDYRNVAFEVPIYVKPKFKLGPGDMFFLAGPKLLILLNDFTVSHVASGSNISYENESDYQIGRQFHLGMSFGFGYDLNIGPGKLQFALTITPYLTNYGKDYTDAIQNEAYLNVGYAYVFK